jgi:fatty-acyl-CoA synthase
MAGLHSGGALGALFLNAFARFGDRPAIADDVTRWTYSELADNVARLITLFRSIGLKKGAAVSVLSTNRVESWAVIGAPAIMGMRYTPLHPLAAEDDHAFIIEDAEIDALVVESGKFAPRPRDPRASPGPQTSPVVRAGRGHA